MLLCSLPSTNAMQHDAHHYTRRGSRSRRRSYKTILIQEYTEKAITQVQTRKSSLLHKTTSAHHCCTTSAGFGGLGSEMDPTPRPPVASNATTNSTAASPPATNGAVSSGRLVAPANRQKGFHDHLRIVCTSVQYVHEYTARPH